MTTDPPTSDASTVRASYLDPLARRLIEALERLVSKDDRGALAQLRRSAGKMPGEAEGVFQYIAPYVPERPREWIETCRYLVGGLFALHPPGRQSDGVIAAAPHESLGATVCRMAPAEATNRQSVERRFSHLLVADAEELPDRLRQIVALLRSSGYPIDWRRLLEDLETWHYPRRRVQRQWARDFWPLPESEPGETGTPPAATDKT